MLFLTFLVALLLGGAQAVDRFFFSQCECTGGVFASADDGGIGDFTRNPLAENGSINCPGTERGLIKNYDVQGSTASIDGILPTSFFNDQNGRVNWFTVVEIDFNGLFSQFTVQTIQLLSLQIGTETLPLTADLQTFSGVDFITLDWDGLSFDFETPDATFNTLVFGEIRDGIRSGTFLCLGGSNGVITTCDTDVNIGERFVDGINANVAVTLLAVDNSNSQSLALRSLLFENNVNGLNDQNFGEAEATTLLSDPNLDLSDGSLPVFNGETIPATEDIVLNNVDLNAFLQGGDEAVTFDVNDPLVITNFGTLAGLTNGIFATFTPVLNAFGNATFSFSYTADLAYECVITVDAAIIEIESDDDIPVLLEVAPQQSIAFVNRPFAVEVAESIDFPSAPGVAGVMQRGLVRVATGPGAGALTRRNGDSCTSTPIAVGEAIELVNGEYQFCYEGDANNVAGNSDSFTFTVRPLSNDPTKQAAGNGTITLNGGNPVTPNNVVASRSQFFVEDTTGTITVLEAADGAAVNPRNVFAVLDNLADPDFEFRIEIVTIPDVAVGQLQTTGGQAISAGNIFNRDESFEFVPAGNFFNANANGGDDNDAGVVLFNQGCVANEQIGGVCPDTTFTYRVIFGTGDGVPSDPVSFGIVVQAADDAAPVFSTEQEEAIIANSNNARNDLIRVNGAALQVESDNAQNVFNIGLRFEGVGGVLIGLPVRAGGEPQGFRLDTGVQQGDCITQPCAIMHLIGTPGQLNAFLDRVEFNIPVEEDGAPPRVDVTLAAGVDFNTLRDNVNIYDVNTLSAVNFDVQAIDEGFFDDVTNVAIVAGSAGGLLLIVLVAVIVRATTVNSVNGEKVKRLSETGPKKFKQRGGVAASKEPKRRRSFEDSDVEDEEAPPPSKKGAAQKADDLLDWEKHIDPKTKQPFYHNTRTKETVWELPEGL